jgi:cell division protein FtsN
MVVVMADNRQDHKQPIGSSASVPGGRPRAQVSYEGEDEFSMMSLEPGRKEAAKAQDRLAPGRPGAREQVKVDQLKSTNDQGIVGLFRKIFAR